MEAQISRIYLTGFMGSGKSSIGLILANTLGWTFIDLDKCIEAVCGEKVTEIFKTKGETYFREVEHQELVKTAGRECVIVALGGGAILRPENLQLIRGAGKLIYLRIPPEKIYARLRFKTDRPLFQTTDNIILSKEKAIEKITGMLKEREKYYEQADLIYEAANYSIGYSVDQLKKILSKSFKLDYAKN